MRQTLNILCIQELVSIDQGIQESIFLKGIHNISRMCHIDFWLFKKLLLEDSISIKFIKVIF